MIGFQFRARAITTVVLLPLLLLFGLTACRDTAGDRVVIRFWNGFTGPDGRTMLRLVRRFNRENPDVQVLMQRMDWSTYYNKLFVAGMGGRAPEVCILYPSVLPRFMQAGFIRSIDDLVNGPNGINTTDFIPAVWKAVEIDGRHYSVPLDVPTVGLYYNKKLFREAGIVDTHGEPRPPINRAEFLDALARLTRDTDGDGHPDQWGFGFATFRFNLLSLMPQWSGVYFTPERRQCILDDPGNAECLRFCANLIHREGLVPEPQDFATWIGFRQGKVAMVFEGVWMVADLQKQTDLEYGCAPVPQLGVRPATWATSHTLCLRRDLEPAQLEAAWRFVRFLSDNALDWAEGGQIPARHSQLESRRFSDMYAQATFAKQIPHIRFDPPVPFIFEFQTEFDAAVERTLRGSCVPEVALAEATEHVNDAIRRHRDMIARAGLSP